MGCERRALVFGSTSLSLIEKSLDKFGDEFLLSPWEFHGLLEDLLEFSGWSGASSSNRASLDEKVFNTDA